MNEPKDLPPEQKKRLTDLLAKVPLIEALDGEGSEVIFLLQVISWTVAPTKDWPPHS